MGERPTTNANRQDGPLRRHGDTPNEVRSCAWSVLACLLQEHQRDSTSYQRMEIAARCKVPRERPGAQGGRPNEKIRWRNWSRFAGQTRIPRVSIPATLSSSTSKSTRPPSNVAEHTVPTVVSTHTCPTHATSNSS